ncbi:hypothetical protein M8J76_015832 [Diaphorina citri]|nr:hypothetical protein M8J75_007102 [Diaphorina citri]KAI5722933.1 hypothetical protein M8J76_015832 [Diaphorina citri]
MAKSSALLLIFAFQLAFVLDLAAPESANEPDCSKCPTTCPMPAECPGYIWTGMEWAPAEMKNSPNNNKH